MILKLSLDLPENQAYIRITRLLGRALLEHLHVVEKDIDDIELVVGELCTNVVRHAQSDHGVFRLVIEYHHDRVSVSVEDQGRGFSFREVPTPGDIGTERDDTLLGGERYGGFGLHLVNMVADHLEFRRSDPHGATVRAEKRLHYKGDGMATGCGAPRGGNDPGGSGAA